MPSIFDFANDGGSDAKMHVSIGSLPTYIDPAQPPTKKSPWRQINEVRFVHTVTLIMSKEMYELVWDKLELELKKVKYAKVMMKLEDVLDVEFFTYYIKKGSILMLSDGRPGVDNFFTLQDGVLRLDLDKESYERAGLHGQPVRGGGRKHIKARYLVEVELRQPSMLHGKKGFERLIWAAKNVLNASITWLFADLGATSLAPASRTPLGKHHPTCLEIEPSMQILEGVAVPAVLQTSSRSIEGTPTPDNEDYFDLIEWLDLLALESPSVFDGNAQDTYITRYITPYSTSPPQCLSVLQVHGLISDQWVRKLLTGIIRLTRTVRSDQWLAFTITAHRTNAVNQIDGYTVVMTPHEGRSNTVDTTEDSMQIDSDSGQSIPSSKGLQHYATIQMMDAVA